MGRILTLRLKLIICRFQSKSPFGGVLSKAFLLFWYCCWWSDLFNDWRCTSFQGLARSFLNLFRHSGLFLYQSLLLVLIWDLKTFGLPLNHYFLALFLPSFQVTPFSCPNHGPSFKVLQSKFLESLKFFPLNFLQSNEVHLQFSCYFEQQTMQFTPQFLCLPFC